MASADTWADLAGFVREGWFAVDRHVRIVGLTAPRSVLLGEPFTIQWQADNGRRTTLELQGVISSRREVPAEGRWTLHAPRTGVLLVTLTCAGEPDPLGQATLCSHGIEVVVKAPEVKLFVPLRRMQAVPGSVLKLCWRADGTSHVELVGPTAGQRLRAPATGCVEAVMGVTRERVHVLAVDHDGKVAARAAWDLHPEVARDLEPPTDLSLIHHPLEEMTWL